MQRFIDRAKEAAVVKVIATKEFGSNVINREDLGGRIHEGDTIEVSENDAQYLEREGYAERVVEEAADEKTAAAPESTTTPAVDDEQPASTAPPED